ncbi:MAG: glycoside hydrolase family 27 protein [Calditrichaceae bacterium]|nr:glycoside hydrolase family 27 protein [Calditrichaceae bacterium]MBN2708115.1 glycoside hydrolase family 27 protein [Calditrichaceae bacterium]RQV94458.1 MAG: glycoside hydrolase family 27 protein [Calditrichota bacterium]
MKKIILIIILFSHLAVFGQFPDIAKTPPMGWNSWNAFGLDINSKIVMAVADSMVAKGMAAAGYEYIVIDDGWQIDRDENGIIVVDSMRFPEGIKFLADYVHARGLKFGIYTCCGTKTCGGRPGSYGYEAIDAKTYAEWGVDYIKEDWCYTDGLETRIQYKIMSDAIRATGRPMLLSLCEWGVSSPWEWAQGIGTMWRTTNDIQDCFDCVRNWGGMGFVPILNKNADLAPYAGPGHWNDPDMLEVGNQALTPTECRSHFAMWCMLAAPLIAGNNISTMNDTIRDILTAPEIIAIDQDPLGIQGIQIKNKDGLQVWQKPLSDGSIAVAMLNLTNSETPMSVKLEEIGFKNGVPSPVRDLWNCKDLEAIKDIFQTKVEPHGVVVVKIKGEKAPVAAVNFDQSLIKMNKDNHRLIKVSVVPSISQISVSSSNDDIVSVSLAGVNKYRLKAKKTGNCVLTAIVTGSKLSASCQVKVLPSDIPTPWKFAEINNDKASVFHEKGIFTIEANGADIWSGSDQFAFLYREESKDNSILARIISQTNPDPWAKTGLMFRERIDPKSKFIMLCITPENGISLQWRESVGKGCNKKDFTTIDLPAYFKLSRKGLTFKAYKSVDGIRWDFLNEVTFCQPFSEKYLIGLEVVSHSTHMMNVSKFDHVKVEQAVE